MDTTDFSLGRGGVDWGLPSTGWWNNPRPTVNANPTPTVLPYASGVSPGGGMDLTSLTRYINTLNRNAQTAANRARIPNAGALETQSSANIGNELRGQVAPDVLRLLQQQAAERGVRTGVGASPNTNAAYLQALGLTSMGLQEQGQGDLTRAYARNPAAPIFDPSTQIMSPYQSASLSQQDRFEQDRNNLERQRLALDAAHIGGGGVGGGGGSGVNRGPVSFDLGYNPATRSGATASDLADTFKGDATQEWWKNIGFNPNTATSSGPGSFTIGSDYLDPSWFADLGGSAAPAGTTTTGTGSTSGIDWSSLFSSDLGFDPSLYSGG